MATYHYHYDPLDRLIQTAGIQRFYNQSRMTTELEGTQSYSVFQQDGRLLAQRRRDRTKDECHLLGTDLQQSVLHAVSADKHYSMAYNAYGHRPVENGLISLLGFNGERADPVTGHYLLGNGYRAFNPVLMRFNSPDSLSPFERGGINSYGYCSDDPVNNYDPDAHGVLSFFQGLGSLVRSFIKRKTVSNFERIVVGRPMTHRALQRQSSFTPQRVTRDNLDFVGYHGSTDKHQKNLFKGIDTGLSIGKNQLGKGFYITQDPVLAKGYAELTARESGGNATVFNVFVESFSRMKPEVDYVTTIHKGIDKEYTTQTLLRPHIANAILIRRGEGAGRLILPRSAEAPF